MTARGRPVPVLVLLLVGAALLAGCGSARQTPSAEDQVPRLGVVLDRVDKDLAAHRYAAARADLRSMKAAVVRARAAGELRDADAARVLDAVEQLVGRLPAATTTSGPTATSTTASSRPSPSASSKPSHPRTTTRTPSTAPTTASASPTSAPTAPSSAPTTSTTTAAAQVSPVAATSSATP